MQLDYSDHQFSTAGIFDKFCNSNRLCDRSLTSKMNGWGAVMTGPDRSHTSKMTGWGAVCDRSHTSKMVSQ